jgi:hypothetical protein
VAGHCLCHDGFLKFTEPLLCQHSLRQQNDVSYLPLRLGGNRAELGLTY